jgi:acyl-CoA dehydrogenase
MADAEMNIGGVLADQLDRLLKAEVGAGQLALIEAGQENSDLWPKVAELGIQYAMASGDLGAGLGWQDCLPVFEVTGWHGSPVPLAETMLANKILSGAGLELAEEPVALCTELLQLGEDQCLRGEDPLVPWLPVAGTLVGIAVRNSERFVFSLATEALAMEPVETLARIPSARLKLADVPASRCAPAGPETGEAGLNPQLALLRAAQICGVLGRVLELTIDYANTRSQFGRPIARFQAIQHLVADLALEVATGQAAACYGCRSMDEGHALQGAAVAKQVASAAAGEGARISHQVFGAIGVTEEHELHHLTRRLWQWRQEAGSEYEWSEVVGNALMGAGGDALWPALVGERHPLG